jgi:hypothetical protein
MLNPISQGDKRDAPRQILGMLERNRRFSNGD